MKRYTAYLAHPTTLHIVIAVTLIVCAIAMRLMPHPPNFAPVAAVALFGGVVLPMTWAISLPLAVMVVSDLLIGLHPTILFTWGSFLLIAALSSRYLRKITPGTLIGASLGSSVLFYVITNFGVWLEGRLYPLTLEGLGQSYVNALPFIRNTILSDLVFTVLLFGLYAVVLRYTSSVPKKAEVM